MKIVLFVMGILMTFVGSGFIGVVVALESSITLDSVIWVLIYMIGIGLLVGSQFL